MGVANLRSRFASSRSGSSSDMRSSPYAYRDAAVVRGKDQNPVRSGGLRRLGQLASKREASEGSGSVCQGFVASPPTAGRDALHVDGSEVDPPDSGWSNQGISRR